MTAEQPYTVEEAGYAPTCLGQVNLCSCAHARASTSEQFDLNPVTSAPAAPPSASVWEVLRSGSFCRLWVATVVSQVGSQITRIALVLHIFKHTEDVLSLTLLVSLDIVPAVLISPFAGPMADRLNKRSIMVACDLFRMCCVVAIVLIPMAPIIYCMVFLHAAGTVVFELARCATIPLVVPKQYLTTANAADQGAAHVIMVLGPLLGTALYVRFGLACGLVAHVISYCVSVVLILSITVLNVTEGRDSCRRSTLVDFVAGLRYLLGHQLARRLVVLFFFSLLAGGLWWPLAPFFIRDCLGAPASLLGLQTSVFGLGGLVGAILVPAIARQVGNGIVVFFALLSEALIMFIYANCPNLALSTGLIFLWGGVVSSILVPYYSILQDTVDNRFIGRIFSIAKLSESIAILLALILAVTLWRWLSAAAIYCLFSALYFAVVAASCGSASGRALFAVPRTTGSLNVEA